MQLIQHLERHVDLPFASIHQDQIRKCCEFPELLIFLTLPQAMGETPGQHLSHAAIIVSALDAFYLKLSVIIPLWSAVLIDDHRTDRLKSIRVGDIIRFHPRDPVDFQERRDLLHRSDRPALLALQALFILCQNKPRVLSCQLHKLLLGAFLWDPQSYLLPSLRCQPGLQELSVLHVFLEHQLSRYIRCPRIVLLDKAVQDAAPALSLRDPQVKVISADQPAAPDEEDLHDRVFLF